MKTESRTRTSSATRTGAKRHPARADARFPRLAHSRSFRQFRRNRAAAASLIFLVFFVLVAIIGPWLTTDDPNAQHLVSRGESPSSEFWLGTDSFGRDIYSRLLVASRVSIFAAFYAVGLSLAVGVSTGLFAGYVGGRIDAVMSRFVDALLSIPSLILIFGIVGTLGPGLMRVMTAVGLVYSTRLFRVARASALDIGHTTFIEAERSIGVPTWRILWAHLLPNASGPILVQASYAAGLAMVAEASLSFLGLGVVAPQASWGSMVHDGYTSIRLSQWTVVPPSVALSATILALSLLGDGLRDAVGRSTRDN